MRYSTLLLGFLLLCSFACNGGKTELITNPDNEDTSNDDTEIEIEKQRIVNTYLKWSQMLLSQNYDGALAYVKEGSAAETNLNGMKHYWDDGKEAYYQFSNIEAIIDQPLAYGMGWAQGDAAVIRGSDTYVRTFTSTCVKENNTWIISAVFFEDSENHDLYTLSGTVVDISQNPIAEVNVTVTSQQKNESTTTNSNGEYYFSDLEEGSYIVTAEKDGYVAVINGGVFEVYIDGDDDEINFLFSKIVQQYDIKIAASEDTYIDERHPDENYGNSEILFTGYDDLRNAPGNPQEGKIYYKYALIRFDLSDIPPDANILAANLFLASHYPAETNSNVFIGLIDSCPRGDWSEHNAGIEDIPTSLTLIDVHSISGEASRVYYWDVAEAVEMWVNESYPNYGFRIHSTNNESIHDHCNFLSRESGSDGPTLRIVYEY